MYVFLHFSSSLAVCVKRESFPFHFIWICHYLLYLLTCLKTISLYAKTGHHFNRGGKQFSTTSINNFIKYYKALMQIPNETIETKLYYLFLITKLFNYMYPGICTGKSKLLQDHFLGTWTRAFNKHWQLTKKPLPPSLGEVCSPLLPQNWSYIREILSKLDTVSYSTQTSCLLQIFWNPWGLSVFS